MTTITGTLEDTSGFPVHCRVTFKSKSTPLVSGGIIIGATTKTLKTAPTDGTFSVQLAVGKYDVTYFTTPDQTKFEITVPDGNDTVTIGSVTSSSLTFAFSPPNTVWNGVRQGDITFDPIADPGGVSIGVQNYPGGHTVAGETYTYALSYMTADGETALSPIPSFFTPPSVDPGNTALRITLLGNSISRVLARRIWRNKVSPSDGVFYLLAQLAPGVSFYDDWESHADFSSRAAHPPDVPLFNTTSGVIYPSVGGSPILYFSTSGLRCLTNATFDLAASFAGGILKLNADGSVDWANGQGNLYNDGSAFFNGVIQSYGGIRMDGDGSGAGDIRFVQQGDGPVILSPSGASWRIRVSNSGVLSTQLA